MEISTPKTLCKKIKLIDPSASQEEYAKLVEEIRDAKLSVAGCINELVNKRINKTMIPLHQEWDIHEHHLADIRNFISQQKIRDSKDFGIEKYVDPVLPDDFVEHIVKEFQATGYQNGKLIFSYLSPQTAETNISFSYDMSICRQLYHSDYPIDHQKKRIKFEKMLVREYQITIGIEIYEYSEEAKKGLVLHELHGHVKHNDSLEGALFGFVACLKKPEIYKNQSIFFESESWHRFSRAIEARADQIPACISLRNARLIEKWLVESTKVTRFIDDKDHDPLDKRIAMATRIYKLKAAEEGFKFKNSEEQTSLLKFNICTLI